LATHRSDYARIDTGQFTSLSEIASGNGAEVDDCVDCESNRALSHIQDNDWSFTLVRWVAQSLASIDQRDQTAAYVDQALDGVGGTWYSSSVLGWENLSDNRSTSCIVLLSHPKYQESVNRIVSHVT
jgi:hypothetical protein